MPQERTHGAEPQVERAAARRPERPEARADKPPAAAMLALQRQAGNSAVSGLVQRLPMSLKGMRDCGFEPHRGDEWIWWNARGKEPNHVSAIRTDGNVNEFHAKSEYRGGRVNRIDWHDRGTDGDFEGPVTNRQEATDTWDQWLPAAREAGQATASLLKNNKKKT